MGPGALDAVTFDYWNTLVYEQPGHLLSLRVAGWLGVLEEAGIPVTQSQVGDAFEASWQTYVASWEANRQYVAEHAIEDILVSLGVDPSPEVRAALEERFHRAPEAADLHLAPGIEWCLCALRALGLRLGIVCDVGMTHSPFLRAFLERRGLLERFDHCSFSDEVGAYKPSPVIFEHSLRGLGGLAPSRVAHVGDRRRTDVAGALGMGMVAVRYAGIFDDQAEDLPEAHHVVRDYSVFLGALDLA